MTQIKHIGETQTKEQNSIPGSKNSHQMCEIKCVLAAQKVSAKV